MKDIIMQKGK